MGRKKHVVSGHSKPAKAPKPSGPMSQRAYAEHRGCALSAVQRAIKTERLKLSLTKDSRGHWKIISPDVADREWEENTRSGAVDDQPGPSTHDDDFADMSFNEARRRREIETWLATKTKREADELELGVRRGELIPIDEARQTVLDEYTAVKTKLLGIPTRLRQRLQHLTDLDIQVAEDLVREALEALSDGE